MAGTQRYREGMAVTLRRRGQSTVELALTLPVLLLLVLGIVDFGRVFLAANVITHAGGDATRQASVLGTGLDDPGRAAVRQVVIREAARSSVTVSDADIDINYLDNSGNTISCYLDGSSLPTAPGTATCPNPPAATPGAPLQPGDLVQVRVHLPWSAETTIIQNLLPSGFTVDSSAAATVEQ